MTTRAAWAQLPEKPKHSLGACTTYELRNYRAELEQALTELPEDRAGDRATLETALAVVKAEQDSRRGPVGHR